jgi:uncharacterized membrane protein YcjF (UPF0283 family)
MLRTAQGKQGVGSWSKAGWVQPRGFAWAMCVCVCVCVCVCGVCARVYVIVRLADMQRIRKGKTDMSSDREFCLCTCHF